MDRLEAITARMSVEEHEVVLAVGWIAVSSMSNTMRSDMRRKFAQTGRSFPDPCVQRLTSARRIFKTRQSKCLAGFDACRRPHRRRSDEVS
jgi:hypothetical protein